MLRQFLKDSAIYGLSNLLSGGLSLALALVYARLLTPAEYGAIEILNTFGSFVHLTVALEISQALARFYADAPTHDDQIGYVSTALWFTAGAYALFTLIALIWAAPLSTWLFGEAMRAPVLSAGLWGFLAYGLFYLMHNQLRWELKPHLAAFAALTVATLTLASTLLLVGVLRWGLTGAVVALLIANGGGALVAGFWGRRHYRLRLDGSKLRAMLRFSVPLLPSGIAVFITLYIDRFAIKELMSIEDVGLFAIGYRIAAIVNLAMIGFRGALMPLVYAHYRDPATPAELARLFRYFTAAALLACLSLGLLAREVLLLFAPPDYHAGAQVVSLLAPALLLSGMYIFAPGMAIAKKTLLTSSVHVVGALLNVSLNFILIPRLGLQGAALATFLSAGLVFGLYMFFSQRFYPVPHAWRTLAGAVLMTGLSLGVGSQVSLTTGPSVALKLALIAGVAAVFVWNGMVSVAEVRRAWQTARARLSLS